ncbi:P-loop NTPase fold protein [Flavobacterium suncheonense]|uniref:KAP NTPase domain-containing protein n=1 Tax=Flavobacterium suncheonense GH29-5 = DSM 17707 TaxID=1121899 RepID=A0A0A2MD05_9FLAO|nr:P-loop NTPase fold protein [Flavobacterium suncheonense]KGO90562.1 hypothetical protein Q764_00100 [Flavobacterium suncheonense GH29-5 = DSM 17707]
MSDNYPRFISTLPLGVDKLKGSSHDNIAKSISSIIKNQSHEIKKQIIGLEGDWGSGKSNIIKIIQREEEAYLNKEKYVHFIYDSWGHQEDLNRRALLEELIDFLDLKEIIPQDVDWKKKKNELKGKTVTSIKNIYPEIKFFWIIFILCFLFYAFLKTIYPIISSIDFIPNNNLGVFKELLLVWFIPAILFGIGFYHLVLEIKNQFEENEKEGENKLTGRQLLGQIFYLLNGKEIKSNTVDYVIENEPSNKEFRRFLKDINKELLNNGKTLILTIDNIDRLSKEKVKALWSTINIFFAENSENELYDNIWLIIPYDESKIVECFTENNDKEIGRGLIDKTFAVKFRVTPPLFSNWEQLLEENLVMSFGANFINNVEETHFVKRIFDNYITDSVIKPRQIINYVNDIVTLHLQYPEINFRYLALFSMTKDSILNDEPNENNSNRKRTPNEMILSRSYINENTQLLFKGDRDIDKSMAAIVFGVSLDNAEEVLMDREIETILVNGKVDELNKFLDTVSFPAHFEKKFAKISLSNITLKNIALLPDILTKLEDLNLVDKNIISNYWRDLNDRLISNDYYHKEFYDLHKKITLKDISLGKSILNKCVDVLYYEIRSASGEEQYINGIYEVSTFLDNEVEGLDLKDLDLKNRSIEPSSFFYLLEKVSEDYIVYNLTCTPQKIREYFYTDDNILDIERLESELKGLKILKENVDFDFTEIVADLKSGLNEITESNIDEIKYYFECLQVLTDSNPIDDISVNKGVINSSIRKSKDNKEILVLLLAFALKNAHDLSPNYEPEIFNEIQSLNDESTIRLLALKIENVITFQKLLEIIIENQFNYELLKRVVKEMTNNSHLGKRLNIKWVLENFQLIEEIIFENNDVLVYRFYRKLSGWAIHVEEKYDKKFNDITNININVVDYVLKIDNNLSKVLVKYFNSYFKELTKEKYYDIFENRDLFHNQLFRKMNNKKIEQVVYFEKVFPCLMEYLKDFASSKINVQQSQFVFLKKLLIQLDKKIIVNFYKSILDSLNCNSSLNHSHIIFFFDDIVNHNLLIKKPDESINGILKVLLENDFLYGKYFSKHYKLYVDVVSKGKDNKASGIVLLKERLKNYPKKNDMRVYADKKIPNWSKTKR